MKTTLQPNGRRPFRLWMTGSLAVVMASLGAGRVPLEDDADDALRVLRHSRYGLNETVQRIEAAARSRGQSVLVMVGGAQPVIVLASSVGGTPVLMSRSDSRPDVPLSMQVRRAADGGTDVLLPALPADSLLELPPTVIAEITALPGMLERALA